MGRGRGSWVMAYSITEAASSRERHREELDEAIAFGIVPAMRSPSGDLVIWAPAIAGWSRRVSEHD